MAGGGGRNGRMMDFILEAWVSSSIERARAGWMLGSGKRWKPGDKLKLLFAGYNGTRNMGSDVRVEEMLRQIRHILGAERVAFSVMSQNFDFSRGYFEGTKQVHLLGSLEVSAREIEVLAHHAERNPLRTQNVPYLPQHFFHAHIRSHIPRSVIACEQQFQLVAGLPALART